MFNLPDYNMVPDEYWEPYDDELDNVIANCKHECIDGDCRECPHSGIEVNYEKY